MLNLKNILIICAIASFALASCSKLEPLKEVTTTETNDSMETRLMPVGNGGESEGDETGDITDPDHDEDHDKDKAVTTK